VKKLAQFQTAVSIWQFPCPGMLLYPTLVAKTGSVIVWTKSRARYIYVSVDVVSNNICLLNSACRQGVCLCDRSRYLIRIYVSDIYIYCHYLSTQLRLPKLGVCVCGRSHLFDIHICFCRCCPYDDDCFYYHSWRNNVVIAFGNLWSFLT